MELANRAMHSIRGRVTVMYCALHDRLRKEAKDRNTWVRAYVIVGIATVAFFPTMLTLWAGKGLAGPALHRMDTIAMVLSVLTTYLFFAWLSDIRRWRDKHVFLKGRVAIIPYSFDFLRAVLNLPEHLQIKMVGEIGGLSKETGAFGVVVEGKYIPDGQVFGDGSRPLVLCYRELADDEYAENTMRRLKLVRIDGLDT